MVLIVYRSFKVDVKMPKKAITALVHKIILSIGHWGLTAAVTVHFSLSCSTYCLTYFLLN